MNDDYRVGMAYRFTDDPQSGEVRLTDFSDEVDLEVRTIWQPWLRARCNFAVRYVVPNRSNIIKIMQKKGKFNAKVFMKSKRMDKRKFGPR